jgi:hypothetical protein
MFGFGKSEAEKQLEQKIQGIQDTACNVIMTQFAIAGTSTNAEGRARARAPYVCGYIFGSVDSLLQLVRVTEDDVKAMAAMTIVHIRLFGQERGSKIFGESLSLQEHPEFARGRMRGGQEVRRWLADPNPKGFVPMSLARYLLSGREPTYKSQQDY